MTQGVPEICKGSRVIAAREIVRGMSKWGGSEPDRTIPAGTPGVVQSASRADFARPINPHGLDQMFMVRWKITGRPTFSCDRRELALAENLR